MAMGYRVAHAWFSGVATTVVATRIFVTHDATWFTYLGIPLAAVALLVSLSR
jgi:hypothetical protein